MLRSEELLHDLTAVKRLSAAAYRRLGSNRRVRLDEVVSEVIGVLHERGLLVPGLEVKETFVFTTAKNIILSMSRKLRTSPLPLTADITADCEDEDDEPAEVESQPKVASPEESQANQQLEQLRASMPQREKVERTVRELQREAVRIVRRRVSLQVRLMLRLSEEGMTHEEIAQMLEGTRWMVSQALARFYREVRIEYGRLYRSE